MLQEILKLHTYVYTYIYIYVFFEKVTKFCQGQIHAQPDSPINKTQKEAAAKEEESAKEEDAAKEEEARSRAAGR